MAKRLRPQSLVEDNKLVLIQPTAKMGRTDYVSRDLSTVLPGEIDRNRTSDCRIILYLNLYF